MPKPAPRKLGMHEHDRAAIAVKERMPMGEVAHHFPGLLPHERLVLTLLQRVVDGLADILGVGEQHLTLPHEKMGCVDEAIFARPGKDALEESLVRIKDVAISKRGLAFEMRQSRVYAGQKGVVLQPLQNGGIFGFGDVAEITRASKSPNGSNVTDGFRAGTGPEAGRLGCGSGCPRAGAPRSCSR